MKSHRASCHLGKRNDVFSSLRSLLHGLLKTTQLMQWHKKHQWVHYVLVCAKVKQDTCVCMLTGGWERAATHVNQNHGACCQADAVDQQPVKAEVSHIWSDVGQLPH